MDDHQGADAPRRRALLRFAIIGDLLAAPPPKGELTNALKQLASKTWTLPDGAPVRFGFSTIEDWYYKARNATDPVSALTSTARRDRGSNKVLDAVLLEEAHQAICLMTRYGGCLPGARHPGFGLRGLLRPLRPR